MPATRRLLSLLLVPVLLTACSDGTDNPLPFAVPGSQLPFLDSHPDGSVVMSWVEPDGDGHRLRYASYEGDTWSQATTVARGDDWFVNWADFPSIRIIDGEFWVAHWLVRSGTSAYAYDVFVSVSQDAGRTWSEPFTPHSDGTPTEHGFVSIYPTAEGAGLVWLDGRETLENTTGEQIVGMTLRSATLTPEGEVSETLVDPLVCDCCQTDVAVGSEGPVLVYRDRTFEEIRDIHVARYGTHGWQLDGAVAVDDWQVFGCPVNGPAVAASGVRVDVAWYSQGSGVPLVQLVRSDDGGRTFGDPIAVDGDDPVGRVDVAVDGSGCGIVSWIGHETEGESSLLYRYFGADGWRSETHSLAPISASRPSGFPRMARYEQGVMIAWTDVGESGSQVKVAALEFACPGVNAGH